MLKSRNSSETSSSVLDPQQEPQAAARAAGLKYVTDRQPGISRKRRGSSFYYLNSRGQPVKDSRILARIKSLALPPAWESVWICPHEDGHLQATGHDSKGRKQYRYHADWNQLRNKTKFTKMLVFSEKLPLIRERVKKDLQKSGFPKEKVLAAVIQIMEQTMIRIGNDEYAEKNSSYGLTTIRNHHAEVKGSKIHFRFKGKSGKLHDVEIEDKRIAQIIRKCQDLPGQELFAYETEDGQHADVTSSDVNEYLQEITQEDITAKDFRTWGGTVQAAIALEKLGPSQNKKELKSQIVRAIEQTSEHLRNTPAICKKYYIHPCVLEAYESGHIFKVKASCKRAKKSKFAGLYSEEYFAVQLLKRAEKLP